MRITPELVRGLWAHMSAEYGSRAVDKRGAWEMRAAAWGLERLKILEARSFLTQFTTVIGRRIYTPYAVGVADEHSSLWGQLVTCVHEHQHVEQVIREGRPRFFYRYLRDPHARALYEAEAYTCDLEMGFWATGATPDPGRLARLLFSYGCGAAEVRAAEVVLSEAAEAIEGGARLRRATEIAIAWLEARSGVEGGA